VSHHKRKNRKRSKSLLTVIEKMRLRHGEKLGRHSKRLRRHDSVIAEPAFVLHEMYLD
jgi:hypothetical protein